MPTSHEDLVSRLDAIAEELGERALDVLREAAAEGADRAPAEEKVLTRARRAVEKAAGLLRSADIGVDDGV
ncbi:MAG: hypothetical protein R2726_09740 [Acidimicrobiales bacterium]